MYRPWTPAEEQDPFSPYFDGSWQERQLEQELMLSDGAGEEVTECDS